MNDRLKMATPNPMVDAFLQNGCMRCPYGGTLQCKVHLWPEILTELRRLALLSQLQEEIKWGAPVYTWNGKNIISVSALKSYAVLGFFKGVLLKDPEGLLVQQGRIQEGRIMTFTDLTEVHKRAAWIATYIEEAIEIERSGIKFTKAKVS
jgi:uncharacterized protein YdeI (YjbR/CyaY-like superfamily)